MTETVDLASSGLDGPPPRLARDSSKNKELKTAVLGAALGTTLGTGSDHITAVDEAHLSHVGKVDRLGSRRDVYEPELAS